jgi:hypothetical protein
VHPVAAAQFDESICDVEYLMSYVEAVPTSSSSPGDVHDSVTLLLVAEPATRSTIIDGGFLSSLLTTLLVPQLIASSMTNMTIPHAID